MTDPEYTRRRVLELGAGLALSGGFVAACGGEERKTFAVTSGGSKTIGLSLYGNTASTVCVASGVLRALSAAKLEPSIRQARFSATAERSNIDSLLKEGVGAILMLPSQVETILEASRVCAEQGVPLVNLQALTGVALPSDRFFAGAVDVEGGQEQGGRLIAQGLRDALPSGGKIAVIQGLPSQPVTTRLDRGLDEGLAKAPGIEIVLRGPAGDDPEQARTLLAAALAEHPDLAGVVTYGPDAAAAVAGELAGAGPNRPMPTVHVTSDPDQRSADLLAAGGLTAVRWASPAQIGERGVAIARDVIKTKVGPLDPFLRTVPQALVTKADAAKAPEACYAPEADRVRSLLG